MCIRVRFLWLMLLNEIAVTRKRVCWCKTSAKKILFTGGMFILGLSITLPAHALLGAPVVSNTYPSGLLAPWTTSVSVILNTDIAATCRYATSSADITYDAMPGAFATTGVMAHSFPVSGLVNGETRTFYVRCQALTGVANDISTTIVVSVALPGVEGSLYTMDFEIGDPFAVWANNGTFTINEKKLVTDKSTNGSQSLYIDVTLGTTPYLYFIAPIRFPASGASRFSGDLFVLSTTGYAQAALGTSASAFPAPHSGFVIQADRLGVTPSWTKQQIPNLTLTARTTVDSVMKQYVGGATGEDTGNWIDGAAIYIWGEPGANIKLYVDNIKIDGYYGSPISDYTTTANSLWSAYKARIAIQVNNMADYILSQTIANPSTFQSNYLNAAKARATEVRNSTIAHGFPTSTELSDLSAYRYGVEILIKEASYPITYLSVYMLEPTKDYKINEVTYPVPTTFAPSLTLSAAQGEFEPASFVLRANNETLSGVNIRASALTGPNGNLIASGAIDIRLVKTWYQSGITNIVHQGKFLVPELLVHNDALITNDLVNQKSSLLVTVSGAEQYIDITNLDATTKLAQPLPIGSTVRDASVLQPFAIPADTNKQIWVTVRVPRDAKRGDYTGTITVEIPGKPDTLVPMLVTVLPFALVDPLVEQSMYYRATLSSTPTKLGSEGKTESQLLSELSNMRDHGISYPTVYQGISDVARLTTHLSLMKQSGLPMDKIYELGNGTANVTTQSELDALKSTVSQWQSLATQNNYGQVYVYGIDEATGDKLLAQLEAWKAVHAASGKVFVATYIGTADSIVADFLDVPNLAGAFNPAEVAKWHAKGAKVFNYGNPQVGVESPDVYRRNYGIPLLLAGYDGAMNYAYQDSFGEIWNDFDNNPKAPQYRDHVFAYPTTDGVLDTIQWEGYREAVDDIRYLSTLIALDKTRSKDQILESSRSIVAQNSDPAFVRGKVIDEILTVITQQYSANLTVAESVSASSLFVGDNIIYTINVNNAGPTMAHEVTLKHVLPPGLSFKSVAASQGSCANSNGTVTCALGNLQNASTASVTVTAVAAATGTFASTVSASANEVDPDPASNTASVEVTVSPSADISVTQISKPDTLLVNDNITYTVTLTNNGPSTASAVNLVDNLPIGNNLASTITTQGACVNGQTVTCNFGGLISGATATVTIVTKATTAGTKINTAKVSNVEFDPNTANNTASGTNTILGSCINSSEFKMSGKVTSSSTGRALSGVTMNLIRPSTTPQCGNRTTTASDGTYQFPKLANGTYTVTPSKTGCTSFTPPYLSPAISGSNKTGQNFKGVCP